VPYRSDTHLSKVPDVRTMCHIVWMPICLKHHPSGRQELFVWIFPCVEKFRTALASIRSDVSAARPDDTQCSTCFRISFQNTVMGRSLQPSGRCGFPSGCAHHKASIVFKIQTSGRLSACPDACTSDMEIVYIKSTVRTTIPPIRTCEAFIWKLLAATGQHRLDAAQK
jgi:hypothetical protein